MLYIKYLLSMMREIKNISDFYFFMFNVLLLMDSILA